MSHFTPTFIRKIPEVILSLIRFDTLSIHGDLLFLAVHFATDANALHTHENNDSNTYR